jgi:hypothetical protein
MSIEHIRSIRALEGVEVVRWVANEMALNTPADETDAAAHIWSLESIPYLQLTLIQIYLGDGAICDLFSQLEDGTGYYGLFVSDSAQRLTLEAAPRTIGIFRVRELDELPRGVISAVDCRKDGPNAVVEASFKIGTESIRLLAAEITEGPPGIFRIVEPDETILVQLDGRRPTSAKLDEGRDRRLQEFPASASLPDFIRASPLMGLDDELNLDRVDSGPRDIVLPES